jgi:hypothetical protein
MMPGMPPREVLRRREPTFMMLQSPLLELELESNLTNIQVPRENPHRTNLKSIGVCCGSQDKAQDKEGRVRVLQCSSTLSPSVPGCNLSISLRNPGIRDADPDRRGNLKLCKVQTPDRNSRDPEAF